MHQYQGVRVTQHLLSPTDQERIVETICAIIGEDIQHVGGLTVQTRIPGPIYVQVYRKSEPICTCPIGYDALHQPMVLAIEPRCPWHGMMVVDREAP